MWRGKWSPLLVPSEQHTASHHTTPRELDKSLVFSCVKRHHEIILTNVRTTLWVVFFLLFLSLVSVRMHSSLADDSSPRSSSSGDRLKANIPLNGFLYDNYMHCLSLCVCSLITSITLALWLDSRAWWSCLSLSLFTFLLILLLTSQVNWWLSLRMRSVNSVCDCCSFLLSLSFSLSPSQSIGLGSSQWDDEKISYSHMHSFNWCVALYLTLCFQEHIIASHLHYSTTTFVPRVPDFSSVSSLYFYSPSSISILSPPASSSLSPPDPFIVSFVKCYPLSCHNNALWEMLCASHYFICYINRYIESLEGTSDDWNRRVWEKLFVFLVSSCEYCCIVSLQMFLFLLLLLFSFFISFFFSPLQ